MNCYEDLVTEGKELLRLKFDDTAVRSYNFPKHGLVSLSQSDIEPERLELTSTPQAGKSKRHACCTLLLFLITQRYRPRCRMLSLAMEKFCLYM